MRILIYGINYSPDLTGIGKYSGEMGKWLAENEHHVSVVTAMPYYPQWAVNTKYRGRLWHSEMIDGVKVYRCPLYVPAKPTGLKRMLHDVSFLVSSFFVFVKLLFLPKFDAMITVAPPFHLGLVSLFYRFFKGSKVLYHIQDLQVDAAKELGMIKSKALLSILIKIERYIITKVDYVSSISEGMILKIKQKVERNVIEFPNWVDLKNYYPVGDKGTIKVRWGYNEHDKIILYSGNIGEKQGLDGLLAVAAKFTKRPNVKFIICGTGAYKNKLVDSTRQMNLKNIDFLPLQENNVFNDFLNMADIHLILQKKDASDLVMPSKLTTILAVGGLALVTANNDTCLYKVIAENEMGLIAAPEDVDELYKKIEQGLTMDVSEMHKKSHIYALENLSIDAILSGLINNLSWTHSKI